MQRKMLYALIQCGRVVLRRRLAGHHNEPQSCRAYWRSDSAQKELGAAAVDLCANLSMPPSHQPTAPIGGSKGKGTVLGRTDQQAVSGLSIRSPTHSSFCRLPAGFVPSAAIEQADATVAENETAATWRQAVVEKRAARRPRAQDVRSTHP